MPQLQTRFGPCEVLTRTSPIRKDLPTALLVHGSGGRAEIWAPVLELFNQINPVAVEMPGHGHSQQKLLQSVDDSAALLDDVRNALGLSSIIVVGHSLGGATAQQYARDYRPSCQAIVLASSSPYFNVGPGAQNSIEEEWDKSIQHYGRGQVSPHASAEVLGKALKMVGERVPRVFAHDVGLCETFDSRNWAKDIATPCLVTCAYEDTLTPFSGSLELLQKIPGAVMTVISPGGHSVMLEHPILFARAIDAFVEDVRR